MEDAWPVQEARRIIERNPMIALFETGYGPSGLPHIGTFGEVARTTWVRKAYTQLSKRPSKLLAFSDDLDGLRSVPDNIPNGHILQPHLGKPLTSIPDPFGKYESFGHHNNAMLRGFLDNFGFEYEFGSATQYYRSGRFNTALKKVLENYSAIMSIILPTLGKDKNSDGDRASTYSPLLPVHPITGIVMQVPLIGFDVEKGTITWKDANGEQFETSIYDGNAKCQWKVDWAMRWYALGVDYEMSGKDLIDSVVLSTAICKILGGNPPLGYTYELFSDKDGKKISKSKGNGISVDDWLKYGPNESLAQYMFNNPHRAKKLTIDCVPKAIDEYIANVQKYPIDMGDLNNPAYYIGLNDSPIPFSMLLNLTAVINATSVEMIWGYIQTYDTTLNPTSHPFLDTLVHHALVYYTDKIIPNKKFKIPTDIEKTALLDLASTLEKMSDGLKPEEYQFEVYEVGKRHFPVLKDWFSCLYQVLLGQEEGPRFGAFIALYGRGNVISLIREKTDG